VTQQFNTTSSLGRLTLNILLSFAQFEREIAADSEFNCCWKFRVKSPISTP
jgi:site-specific DNA recombinase